MTHDTAQAGLLRAALGAAQRQGDPIPGSDPRQWSRILRVESKHWSTFERRHPVAAADTFCARVADLARALPERCAPPRNSGTTIDITDCRRLARSPAAFLQSPPAVRTSAGASPDRSGQ